MAEGSAEGVAGAEAVDGFHRDRGGDHALGAGLGHDAFGAELDDGDFDAGRQQPVRLFVGGALPHGDGAFLVVADRDGDVRQDLGDLCPGVLLRGPEHGPVVEVQDGELAFLSRCGAVPRGP